MSVEGLDFKVTEEHRKQGVLAYSSKEELCFYCGAVKTNLIFTPLVTRSVRPIVKSCLSCRRK